jgi:hypothetical protein
MRTNQIKKLLSVLCLSLPIVLTAVTMAQIQTPSILERVQKVEDPELGELIRVAIENHKNLDQKGTLEIIRKVTLSYVQVKLLDEQIAEVSRKIKAETGPAEMRYELLMAKTELESKLMTELANLREIMGIIPKHAFEKQEINALNIWLSLTVVDERVYVLDALKPLSEYWAVQRWNSEGLLTEKQTLDHIHERLMKKSNLPARIDILYVPANKMAAQNLHARIISLVKETNSQMETEVRLKLIDFVGSGTSTFFLREGKIRTLYPAPVKRPDKSPKPLTTGLVNPNDLEQHILWRLTIPGGLPLTFRIEYDQASALTAKLIADTAREVAKRLGVDGVVEVKEDLVEPLPEACFLGRWQAIADSEIREIELQAGGQSRLTMKAGAQKTVPAPWTLGTKDIFIDSGYLITYRGFINSEGNLVVDKGEIFPQGSWGDRGQPEMVFKKVE